MLSSRHRVDAKYIHEVERRSAVEAELADAVDACDDATRERDKQNTRARDAETSLLREKRLFANARDAFAAANEKRDALETKRLAELTSQKSQVAHLTNDMKHQAKIQSSTECALKEQRRETSASRDEVCFQNVCVEKARVAAQALAVVVGVTCSNFETEKTSMRTQMKREQDLKQDDVVNLTQQLANAQRETLGARTELVFVTQNLEQAKCGAAVSRAASASAEARAVSFETELRLVTRRAASLACEKQALSVVLRD